MQDTAKECGVDEPLADIYVTLLHKDRKNTVTLSALNPFAEGRAVEKCGQVVGCLRRGNSEE